MSGNKRRPGGTEAAGDRWAAMSLSLDALAVRVETRRRDRLYRDLRRVGNELKPLHPEAAALAFAWAGEVAA